jgi:hypothetical protein
MPTFSYTGAQQTYVVPDGVNEVEIECWGAEGADRRSDQDWGLPGKGGYVKGTLAVTPGETLNVYVGGKGGTPSTITGSGGAGGWNGGAAGGGGSSSSGGDAAGGGGGASDVRQGGTALSNRKIVGGGGGGYGAQGNSPGGSHPTGGFGGYTAGSQGGYRKTSGDVVGQGGFGGTQTAGGAGGAGGTGTNAEDGKPGSAGSSGWGGGGGAASSGSGAGGGGGGGYYGGGGGGSGEHPKDGGGGGGGSSYIGGVTGGTYTNDTRTGHGLIVITELNQAPNAPTGLSPDGVTIDRTVTQRFSWTFSDPDPDDSESKHDLRYRASGTATWTVVSGTTPNQFHDFPGGTFAAGDYEWQVRTYDAQGAVGPYSASAFFTAADPPAGPTITDPVNGGTIASETYPVQWSTPEQASYQARRVEDDGAGNPDPTTVYAATGEVPSATARAHTLTFETNNRDEHVQVRIKANGLWSTWSSVRVTVSYTPPAAPTVNVTADSPEGAIGVAVVPGAWPVDVSAVTFTGTGDGGMTGPAATDGVTGSHVWEAVCVATAADGGTFDVKVDGTVVGQATVGTQFTYAGLSFTIGDGPTDYALGDTYSWSTTAVKTVSQDLHRRKLGDTGDGIRIATGLARNGSHTDWAVASGVAYEYRARAIGDNGTSTYSAWTA